MACCEILDSLYDDGRRRLRFLEDETDNPHILACIEAAHAIAEAHQGKRESAKSHLKSARKLMGSCHLLPLADVAVYGDVEALVR